MLIVFDLDFTLWDAGGTWCDHTSPPYREVKGSVEDSHGRIIYLYPDVREILRHFKHYSIPLAVASRTSSPETARRLMDLLEIRHYLLYEEIYPGSKVKHLTSLYKRSGIPFEQMYFFDDEYRNIIEVADLGVHSFLVRNGINWHVLKDLL